MDEAERLFRRALTIREENLGVDHPWVSITRRCQKIRYNLGSCAFFAVGRMQEAEKLYRQAQQVKSAVAMYSRGTPPCAGE